MTTSERAAMLANLRKKRVRPPYAIISLVASAKRKIVPEAIRQQAETWVQTAARLLGQDRT